MKPAVQITQVSATDVAAVEKVCASVPREIAADVRELAVPAMRDRCGRRWSAQLHRAYFLQQDADGILSCITFECVPSIEKMAELREARDDKRPDLDSIHLVYGEVIGVSVAPIAALGTPNALSRPALRLVVNNDQVRP